MHHEHIVEQFILAYGLGVGVVIDTDGLEHVRNGELAEITVDQSQLAEGATEKPSNPILFIPDFSRVKDANLDNIQMDLGRKVHKVERFLLAGFTSVHGDPFIVHCDEVAVDGRLRLVLGYC